MDSCDCEEQKGGLTHERLLHAFANEKQVKIFSVNVKGCRDSNAKRRKNRMQYMQGEAVKKRSIKAKGGNGHATIITVTYMYDFGTVYVIQHPNCFTRAV